MFYMFIIKTSVMCRVNWASYWYCLSGIFPEPNHDPVIQIANMVIRQGEHEPFVRNVFTLDDCAPIVGCQVLSHKSETAMLEVRDFVSSPTFSAPLPL